MVDNNYNTIKPIQALQNITGLTQVKQRKEKNRQEKQKEHGKKHQEQIQEEPIEIDAKNETTAQKKQTDPNSIDFCA